MKQVILNADDFGKSPQRNQAIDDAFKQGLITSAGLIVTGQYLPEAVELAFRGGYVNHLHLHFNLSTNLLRENSNDIPLSETMRSDSFFCKNGRFLKYSGLPNRFLDIRKWRVVYQELVAQFDKFKEITQGKADYGHVDFHLWYNLTWPVSLALNLFTRKFKISSARYFGLHQKDDRQFFFYRLLGWNPRVEYVPATNIDYYLTKNQSLTEYQTIELYCHPNYKEGVFLDDSPSYLGHERQPLEKHIDALRELDGIQFISWEDYR